MIYLFVKIIIWILLAALLGFLTGWYLYKNLIHKKAADKIQEENKILRNELDICQEKIKKVSKTINSSTHSAKDNLQKISGIGSILEQKLNHLGVFTFEQIANWDKNDIRNISMQIGPFRDRIERDNWIIQAKQLKET